MNGFDKFTDPIVDAWTFDGSDLPAGGTTPIDKWAENVVSAGTGFGNAVADAWTSDGVDFEDYVESPLDKWLGLSDDTQRKKRKLIWRAYLENIKRFFFSVDLTMPMGILFSQADEAVYVQEILTHGSAVGSQVSPGDTLVGIDYEVVFRRDLQTMIDTMKASKKKSLTLTFVKSQVETRELTDRVLVRVVKEHWLEWLSRREALILTGNPNGIASVTVESLRDLESLQRLIYRLQSEVDGTEVPDTIRTMGKLSRTLQVRGEWKAAESWGRRALKGFQHIYKDPDHPSIIDAKSRLSWVVADRGNLKEAEDLQRDALDSYLRVNGTTEESVSFLLDLTGTMKKRGNLEGAEKLERKMLSDLCQTVSPDTPKCLWLQHNLGETLLKRGMLEEAVGTFDNVTRTRILLLGVQHPDTLRSLNELGKSLKQAGQFSKAIKIHQRVLDACRRMASGHDDARVVESKITLACSYRAARDYKRAEELFREALNARNSSLGPDHPETLYIKGTLAKLFQLSGDLVSADQLFREVVSVRNRTLGPEHPDTLWSLEQLARTARMRKDFVFAEELQRQALAMRLRQQGPNHPSTLVCKSDLARILRERGDESAEPLIREVVEGWSRIRGPQHKQTILARYDLAQHLISSGHSEIGKKMLMKVFKTQLQTFGKKNKVTRMMQRKMRLAASDVDRILSELASK